MLVWMEGPLAQHVDLAERCQHVSVNTACFDAASLLATPLSAF